MIIKKTWFTAGTVFVRPTVFAQHGLGRHGPGPVRRQRGPGPHPGPAYDTNGEATFTGTVADVKTGGHTIGQGQSGVQETRILLKTDTGTVEIHLGPTAFLAERKVEITAGDTLEVTGSRVTIGESHVVVAREVRNSENAWTLRDATGQPLWSSFRTEVRGFWTTKRIVLAALAVKAAVVAALLLT